MVRSSNVQSCIGILCVFCNGNSEYCLYDQIIMIVGKNKLADREQRDLLTLLRSIAWARTEESCLLALGTLRDSYLYNDNQQVMTYVEQRWLAIKEVRHCH